LDGTRQIVGSGPLLADVDLIHRRGHLALQLHTVEVKHAHSAVAVVIQTAHELNRYSVLVTVLVTTLILIFLPIIRHLY
ncbi:MAG: hypothetical protein ACK56I_25580, partial [bacterium]